MVDVVKQNNEGVPSPVRQRDARVEAYRIFLMFGVCLCHTLFVGTMRQRIGVSEWLLGVVSGAVDGFVFISGWYGIRFRWSKLLALYGLAFFCALECRCLAACLDNGQWKNVVLFYKDVVTGYWFLHAYAALMLVSPILNAAFEFVKDDWRKMIGTTVPFLFFVFGWGWIRTRCEIFNVDFPLVHSFVGHSWLTLAGVYVAARACRVCGMDKYVRGKWVLPFCGLLACVNGFQFSAFGGYNSPVVLAMTVCAFCWVKTLSLTDKMISTLGGVSRLLTPSLFAVYLLHQSPFGHELIHRFEFGSGLMLGCVVFVGCLLFDMPRRLGVVVIRKFCFTK